MRVIGGTARGRRLEAPKGTDVRPTLDRVRESLFNIIGGRLEGARFLDLFAGTGANGIEALSRGAAACTFVDEAERSLAALRRNLEATRLSDRAKVMRLKLPAGLGRLGGDGAYNVIFADPPYAQEGYDTLLAGIREAGLLAQEGLIVLEHGARVELPDEMSGFRCIRRNRYGESALTFFS